MCGGRGSVGLTPEIEGIGKLWRKFVGWCLLWRGNGLEKWQRTKKTIRVPRSLMNVEWWQGVGEQQQGGYWKVVTWWQEPQRREAFYLRNENEWILLWTRWEALITTLCLWYTQYGRKTWLPWRTKRIPGPSSMFSNVVVQDPCLHSYFQFLMFFFFPSYPSNSDLSLHFALTSLRTPNHDAL